MMQYIIPAAGLIVVAIIEAIAMRERKLTKEERESVHRAAELVQKLPPEKIDEIDGKIDALVKNQKVMAVDRIRYLGLCYLGAKSITLEEKETLHEMHEAYKSLGGNGHLNTVMEEIDKLPIVKSRFERE